MALKLSFLTISNRITKWVNLTSRLSSLSCANTIPVNPEIDINSPHTCEFEAKIQSLRNMLCPDNLIRVLDHTDDLVSALKIFKWVSIQNRFQHTAETYCKMILKLGLAGNVEEMERLCQNMVNERYPNAREALVSLIYSFVNHCRVNEAIRVLLNMNSGGFNLSVDVFNVVFGEIVEKKRGFGDFVFVYKEMVKAGVLPNVDTLNYLLEVLFESHKPESALDQFRRMHKKGCLPNSRTFELVTKGLITNNQVDDSISILGEMFDLGFQPELSFYTNMIPMLCKENKLEEAIQLFKIMRTSDLVPDVPTYDELIKCSSKNLRLDDSIDILEEMMEIGLTATIDVFVDIVRGLCGIGKFDESMNFLEEKCCYATSPHNAMLECCCNAGRFFLAKCILENMADGGIADCDSWNITIRWLCENEEIRKAYELLGRMIVSSVVPDCATYSALVLGNCTLCKYEDALRLCRQASAYFLVLDSLSYSKVVEGLCQIEKITEAVEVFCYMSKNGCSLPSSSFNMLIYGMCVMGKVDEAIRLRSLAYGSGIVYTTSIYTKIMLGLSKLRKAKDLLVVLAQMLMDGCTPDVEAYCILIQSMSEQNRTKDCALFFNMMEKAGLVPDRETMCSLLFCLANHSKLHLVSSGISKIVFDSEVQDSSIYRILINGLWKEGLKSEASYLLDLMLEKGWVPDATTHRLLVGSSVEEELDGKRFAFENSILQDSVSDILAEGLRNTG